MILGLNYAVVASIACAGLAIFILVLQTMEILMRIQESLHSGSSVALGHGSETDMSVRRAAGGLLPEDLLRIKMLVGIVLGAIVIALLLSQIGNFRDFGFVMILLGMLMLLVVFFISFTVPDKVIAFLQEKRIEKMNRQLADAMNILSLSLRSGKTFEAALPVVAKELPSPLGEEFERVVQEIAVAGVPLRSALQRMSERVPFKDMQIFVSTVLIVLAVGGHQADILDRSSDLIRQRFQIKQKCKALTAEGRFTAIVISLAPMAILAGNLVVNYEMTFKFITHPIGILVLTAIGISDYIGYKILMRIVKSDF
jgi:Flp pilus assembly protein TadB